MSDPEELYHRHSKSFDKLHASEKEEELVEKIEAAMLAHDDYYISKGLARAALAAARPVIRAQALEEAARVVTGSRSKSRAIAAIRALKEKE